MIRVCLVCAGMAFPLLSIACDAGTHRACKERFSELVTYRAEAIENAFGDLFGTLPANLQIKFVDADDPQLERSGGKEIYDQKRRTLIFPRRYLSVKTPNPLRSAVFYWPFYQNSQYRQAFPVVETVDNLLFSAYLQEAAQSRGLSWPHTDCNSHDLEKRLPCEMLVEGISEHLKMLRSPIFNANRLDMIWPEDFSSFRKHLWNKGDQQYLDVQRYGGIMLLRPLIDEFGVARALAYVAQTPFRVEENNLRFSALRYQERARQVLH